MAALSSLVMPLSITSNDTRFYQIEMMFHITHATTSPCDVTMALRMALKMVLQCFQCDGK